MKASRTTPAIARRTSRVWESAATSPARARRGRGEALRGSSSSSKKDTVSSAVWRPARRQAATPPAGVRPAPPNKAPMDATGELPAVTAEAGAPAVLGRYRLGARLGSGGFGTVYAAHDERLDRQVAVKVIPTGARAPERASREALAAARLDHPGIVAVFDAGED